MDFWFLLECEVEDDFLSVGGGPEGDVLVGPAILTNTTTGYPVDKARNRVVKEQCLYHSERESWGDVT